MGTTYAGPPIEERKHALANLLFRERNGIVFNQHYDGDGAIIYKQACELGCEGILSKRRGSPYQSGRVTAGCRGVRGMPSVRIHVDVVQPRRITTFLELCDGVISDRKSLFFGQSSAAGPGLSTRTDDIRVGIVLLFSVGEERSQIGRQLPRQLAFNSKLLPNRYLHLATQSYGPFARLVGVRR